MKTSTLLKRAYKLIKNPENWTQGELARDRTGIAAYFDGPHAVCFCASGAVIRSSGIGGDGTELLAAHRLLVEDAQRFGFNTIPDANDDPNTTHAQVLAAFRRAYRKAKQLEGEKA